MHPLRKSGFRGVECFRPPDGLPPCPTRIACRRTAFTAQLQLKLGEARQNTCHHRPNACPHGRRPTLDAERARRDEGPPIEVDPEWSAAACGHGQRAGRKPGTRRATAAIEEPPQRRGGAVALTAEQLPQFLANLRASDFCKNHDLIDPITLLIATGLRRSELLGLRWVDFDEKASMLAVTGKVIRVPGEGLLRVDETKSTAGRRTIPLPKFAADMLLKRRHVPYLGQQAVIFPSTAGTLRDPNNFGKEWRTAREALGVAEVTTHSFRKTVATLIDDEGLSARIGADHLGHSHVSMTQDRYMTRGRIHTQVADLLDRTVRINDE